MGAVRQCIGCRNDTCLISLSDRMPVSLLPLKGKGLGMYARPATVYWMQKRHLPDQLVLPYACLSPSMKRQRPMDVCAPCYSVLDEETTLA